MQKSFFRSTFPYTMLIAYVLFVSYNFYNLNSRLNHLLDHPVRVLQDAREIKTRFGEMRYTLPGLMANPDIKYEEILTLLDQQDNIQDKSFGEIKKLFVGKREYLDELENAFIKIRLLRREAAKLMIGNGDYNQAMHTYNAMVAPQVIVVEQAVDNIIASATRLLAKMREKTARDAFINVIITLLVGLFIGVTFFAINRKEQLKTRQLEDRDTLFNQFSRNVDEIFIIAVNDHTFDYVTANSERIIKIPAQAIKNDPQRLYDFLPEKNGNWLKNALDFSHDNDSPREETVIMDNGTRIFRTSVYPFRDGNVTRAIVAIQDITREFLQKQALSDAMENAQAANVAKSSFLSHMSHEIRTPMNAIMGMTTIALNRMSDSDRVRDCLVKISESSKHLLRLINNVLDMSKIENNKLSLNHESFSLPSAISSINGLVRPQAEARKLNFEIFQEDVDEENLVGDPLRLNQVILNILSNSLKFTPPGGTLTLTVRQLHKSGNTARFAFIISDNGIGMSQEFLERIFKPFEQASAKTATLYGGTGLGMSITFNLIMLMGGTIQVDSKEGEGSTFTVELPFAYEEKSAEVCGTLPKLKVLVVDDDHGTCEHASLLLEKMGMTPHWCTTGEEAVKTVKAAHDSGASYDVCFIDWKMPGMDGEETAKKIREIVGDELTIIIITAYDWSAIEEQARQAGVNDFLAKPFFASSIYNALISSTRQLLNNMCGDGPHAPAAGGLESARYNFAGKRILLVEDNEFNREIAHEFLDMVHADVEDAVNGEDAVEKFKKSGEGYYDLILMDVQMPIMDGYEATKLIRVSEHGDAQTIPIIAMTANAFSEDVAKAVASGMNAHIAKPIDPNKMYEKIQLFLQKSAAAKAANVPQA